MIDKKSPTIFESDVFRLLDRDTASLLRANLSMDDVVTLACSYSSSGELYALGNKRQKRLFRKLDLVKKAKGQEGYPVGECQFVLSDLGSYAAKHLKEAHEENVERKMYIRAQTSVLVGQLKRAGHKQKSDEILLGLGVKSGRASDIKEDRIEQAFSELSLILEQTK